MTAIGNPPPPPTNGNDVVEGAAEEILVLYGSQTGNSEAAAHEICSLLPAKLSSSSSSTATTSRTSRRVITSRVMHLDDFLEVEKARWTRLVIIVTSSYGVGQAPIGARKFRDVCDEILNRYDDDGASSDGNGRANGGDCMDKKKNNNPRFLEGVQFALLGLGDSHYTTFFKNPTTIHKAMTLAGATLVGDIGKADASGTGNMEQSKVIDRWIENIWGDLAKAVTCTATSDNTVITKSDQLEKARIETWEICLELFPEWRQKSGMTNYASMMVALYIPLIGIVVALLAHHFFLKV